MRRSRVSFTSVSCLDISPDAGLAGFIEPFDEGLDRHIWSLSDQSLQWDGEIARKRREKPVEVERLMRELVEAQKAVDEEEEEAFKRTSTGNMAVDEDEHGDATEGNDLGEYEGMCPLHTARLTRREADMTCDLHFHLSQFLQKSKTYPGGRSQSLTSSIRSAANTATSRAQVLTSFFLIHSP